MSDARIFWIRELPAEMQSATVSLSPHGMCAFIRLYWSCFHRQPLADDDKTLARITGLTVRQWKAVREEVKQHFVVDDSGWFSPMMSEKLSESAELRKKRADAGRKGGEATAKKHREADHVH